MSGEKIWKCNEMKVKQTKRVKRKSKREKIKSEIERREKEKNIYEAGGRE